MSRRSASVNSVMATDIMDKDLKTLRNNRWDRPSLKERRLGQKSPGMTPWTARRRL